MKNSAILVSILAIMLAIGLGLTGCTATSPTTTQTQTTTKTVIPTPTTLPSPVEPFDQVLSCTIEPGVTITDYVRYLRAGDQVTGVVQLTGLLDKKEVSWSFSIFYREHDQEMSFIQHWQTSWSENRHAFGFTAEQDGEYILRISTGNSTSLDARIDIAPAGWK